jgi:hypothetical protein
MDGHGIFRVIKCFLPVSLFSIRNTIINTYYAGYEDSKSDHQLIHRDKYTSKNINIYSSKYMFFLTGNV